MKWVFNSRIRVDISPCYGWKEVISPYVNIDKQYLEDLSVS